MSEMPTLIIDRFRRLPSRSSETWQGALVRLPHWLDDGPDGKPYRPWAAAWVSLGTGMVNVKPAPAPGPPDWSLGLEALLEFGLKRQMMGCRPGRLEVADAELGARLLDALGDPELALTVTQDLAAVRRTVADMADQMRDGPPPPDALSGAGVTAGRMRAFAVAAARFYEAQPWRHLTDEDLIQVEAPEIWAPLRYATVMGAAGRSFGLAFFASVEDFENASREADPDEVLGPEGWWSITFCPAWEVPIGDAELWEEHGLPLAGEEAYPFAAWVGREGAVQRPDAAALGDMEGLVLALAETTEEEMDRGRWTREVRTNAGPRSFTLCLPALLEPLDAPPAAPHAGFPDRRAMERVFAEMERFMARSEFRTPEEANRAIQERFSGLVSEMPSTATTPLERAQELAYHAFEARGRRRIQLARKALELSPDCADAYVVLAEAAPDLERARDLYVQGVAAGERALGPETFEQEAGHFWGQIRTRPYMRARLALAECLAELGQPDEAIAHYQALLRLNPEDNQGVRHLLLPALLVAGRDDEGAILLAAYPDEPTAMWRYGQALWTFRREGDSPAARERLREALRANRQVPRYLSGTDEWPEALPEHYALGSEEEAVICAAELGDAWRATPGAEAWLSGRASARQGRKSKRKGKRR